MLDKLTKIGFVVFCILFPAIAAAASLPPIAVFPLQELNRGRNEVNLPFTRALAEHLAASGNEVQSHATVISFMAHSRIRTVGYLESFHITRVREELGAAFVLMGTITQMKERPLPSMGVTLHLVRTTDSRTVWSYVGHTSSADERRVLGIGEPTTAAALMPILLDDIVAKWPWDIIREMQQATAVSIDSVVLHPNYVRPGAEVSVRIRLRNEWPASRAPRLFFMADDQIHAATLRDDGVTYEASWIAGDRDGRFPVNLLLEWSRYGRSETALLGTYLVDGAPPLLELELRGATLQEEIPVFRNELVILPRMIVRKPLSRWRLSFLNDKGELVGADDGIGNLPEVFVWRGRGNTQVPVESGEYEVVVDVWDLAGNEAKASRRVLMARRPPEVELAVEKNGQEMLVDLEHDGKIPLAYWRMEMWSKEGRLIKTAEGRELPAQVGVELSEAVAEGDIEGFLLVQDILGNRSNRNVGDIFQQLGRRQPEVKEEAPVFQETWVDEF